MPLRLFFSMSFISAKYSRRGFPAFVLGYEMRIVVCKNTAFLKRKYRRFHPFMAPGGGDLISHPCLTMSLIAVCAISIDSNKAAEVSHCSPKLFVQLMGVKYLVLPPFSNIQLNQRCFSNFQCGCLYAGNAPLYTPHEHILSFSFILRRLFRPFCLVFV